MLIMGICNPRGEGSDYNGLYFTNDELHTLVSSQQLLHLPVKTEHCGDSIGTIVSAHVNPHGQLQCVMELDEKKNTSSVVSGFIRDGVATELSLGYVVDVSHSNEKLKAGEKRVMEVSVVKKGAREGCHILAYQDTKNATHNKVYYNKKVATASDWAKFCK